MYTFAFCLHILTRTITAIKYFHLRENINGDGDLLIGLSTSDFSYLKAENGGIDKHVPEIDAPIIDLQTPEATYESNNGFLNIPIQSNGCYSGDLFQQGAINETSKNLAKNHFVQVTSHSSIGLLAGISEAIQQTENKLVSTSSVISYTSTTPTLTTQVSAIGQLTDEQLVVNRLSINNATDELQFQGTNPCSTAVQVQTATTETPITYILALTIEDDSHETKQHAELKKTEESFTFEQEPQCVSTKHQK